MRARLSPDDLAAIAGAPPDVTTVGLARRLGLLYNTVYVVRQRMRLAGGWLCRLTLVPCSECGQPVAGPVGRTAHVACRQEQLRRDGRERSKRWWQSDRVAEWRRSRLAGDSPAVQRERERRRERMRAVRRRSTAGAMGDKDVVAEAERKRRM